jgi:FtsP/CotA-like multicopper oxidase with cupredoxin domain
VFEIKQRASLCWYHAHLNEQTGEQVLRGLAGLFLIEDDESRNLHLPSDYGVDDIPLVVQDRRFNADGSFEYLSNVGDIELGYRGDVILVNGTVAPHLELRRQHTRLRILNGSNARIYTLGRDDGADLVVIATDGSLCERPVRTRRVRFGPGERIELLFDMEPNRTVTLMSYPSDSGRMGMMGHGMAVDNETFPIIEFRTGRLEPAAVSFPDRLIRVPQWDPAQAARSRRFTLDMATMSMGSMIGPMMDGSMGINGRSMDLDRIVRTSSSRSRRAGFGCKALPVCRANGAPPVTLSPPTKNRQAPTFRRSRPLHGCQASTATRWLFSFSIPIRRCRACRSHEAKLPISPITLPR